MLQKTSKADLSPKQLSVQNTYNKVHAIRFFIDLYFSPNIIQVIKSRIRWAGHVAHMGKELLHTGVFLWGNLKERAHLEVLGVDGG